jgi:signal peptidase II
MKLSIGKKAIIVVFLVLLIDQVVKIWIKTHMALGQEIRVFDWFIIHFTENPGMAFGMEFGGLTGKFLLSSFRILAIGAIIWYIFHLIKEKAHNGLVLCLSLILAGAIGNILDSVFYGLIFNQGLVYDPNLHYWMTYPGVAEFGTPGYSSFLKGCVVDMLYFPLINTHFPQWFPIWGGEHFVFFRPVFNIADSSITVGVILILLFQKRFFKHQTNS